MPATFEELDVRFLYPDNWKIAARDESEEGPGVTLECPDGTFFSLNRYRERDDGAEILRQAVAAMEAEFDEIESEDYEDPSGGAGEAGAELRFYCLDLLITARFLAIRTSRDVLLVHMQGESRDFDRHALVFQAMLQSLRESL